MINSSDHLDMAALEELKDVMEDEFNILVETFLTDTRERLTHIESAISDKDFEGLRQAAHSMKGSCVNMGVMPLANMCKRLESMGRRSNMDGASEQFYEVKDEFDLVVKILQKQIAA